MLLRRSNGTYVVDGPFGAYHVVPEDERGVWVALMALIEKGLIPIDVTPENELNEVSARIENDPKVWPQIEKYCNASGNTIPETQTEIDILKAKFESDPLAVERFWRDNISTKRLERLKAGFVFSDGNTYPIDPEAQTIFTAMYALVLTGAQMPYMARTANNKNVTMTASEFKRFGEAAFAAGNTINLEAFTAKDSIAVASGFNEKYSVYLAYMK